MISADALPSWKKHTLKILLCQPNFQGALFKDFRAKASERSKCGISLPSWSEIGQKCKRAEMRVGKPIHKPPLVLDK